MTERAREYAVMVPERGWAHPPLIPSASPHIDEEPFTLYSQDDAEILRNKTYLAFNRLGVQGIAESVRVVGRTVTTTVEHGEWEVV